MMQYLKHAKELAENLKSGTIDSDELADKLKAVIPGQYLEQLKAESPQTVIAKIQPYVKMFLGDEAVEILNRDTTVELFEQAMTILKD